MYSITLSDEARHDEFESYHYYERQRDGLGDEFLEALEKCYGSIRKNPQFFCFIDGNKILRQMRLKRFPFVIIFEVTENDIYVYSVPHSRRSPFSENI